MFNFKCKRKDLCDWFAPESVTMKKYVFVQKHTRECAAI